MKKFAIVPVLAGFFVMGFTDIIGTVMNQVKAECNLSDGMAGFLPSMIFIWFLLISIPTGVLCGRIGRKRTVMLSLATTAAAMFLALVAGPQRFWIYFVVFALLGIGNTIIQAALPALLSEIVAKDQLTSRISLGQFVKALCAALTPVFVFVTATWLGNWKLLFPLYGLLTIGCAVWTLFGVPDNSSDARQPDAPRTTFLGSIRLLADTGVLVMVVGVFFSVAADVGFNIMMPEFLKGVYKVDIDKAGMGPTVYFAAKTLGAFLGALIFARVSAAKCFPYSVALAVAGTAAIFFAPTAAVFCVCVFLASLGLANTFGMCMGIAIERKPDMANEVSALSVMAIAGGGVVTPAIGFVQGAAGVSSIVWVLLACLAYLMFAGFASMKK